MTLLLHTGIYLLARLVAGGTAVVALALYTRLLDAHAFGELTLALSAMSLMSLSLANGPNSALRRFFGEDGEDARTTALLWLILPALLACLVAAGTAWLFNHHLWHELLPLLSLLLAVSVLQEFQLGSAQAKLEPWRYALVSAIKGAASALFGVGLVMLGYGVVGALWGVAAGTALSLALNARAWMVRLRRPEPALWRRMTRVAVPISAGAALHWARLFSDRWLLAWHYDANTAGLYAAAYDMTFQALVLSYSVVMLAGEPLVFAAHAQGGIEAARRQIQQYVGLAISLLLPAAVGLMLVAPLLIQLLLGAPFRPTATTLVPVLALALLAQSLTLYPGCAFTLAARTELSLALTAFAAALNVALNLVLIPHYQALGAAISALATHSIGLVLSLVIARRLFALPPPEPRMSLAAVAATAAMAAWLWPFRQTVEPSAVLYVLPVAVIVYAGVYMIVLRHTGTSLSHLLQRLEK